MMRLDERLILDGDEIVDQNREPYSITPLHLGNMLHVAGNSPTGSKRDDNIARAHKPLKPVLPQPYDDEIADCDFEDGKEKSRMPHDHRERAREFLPEYCRLPECPPRSGTARRVPVGGADRVEADRVESFAENTEPTKTHASGTTVQRVGCAVNLE